MYKKILISQLFLLMTVGSGQEWIARYQGPYGADYAYAIAVDNTKNVYVTGASQGSGAGFINDFATVMYDSLGIEQWVARYNASPTHNWPDEAKAIAVDANGVYVTGYISYYIIDDSCDYCTAKYDTETGDTLWMRTYDGPAGACDQACAIAMDGDGYVYVTGKSEGTSNNFDFLTIKYNSDGVEQWTARYNNPAGNGWDIAYALAVDTNGNVYVTGESYDQNTYYDCVTVKYDSLGVQQWVQRYSYEGNWSDEGLAIAVDDTGNVYVTGRSVSTTTSWDYATIKYNSNGIQQWVRRYHGMANYDDEPSGIALDDSGNVYVTGRSGIDPLFRYQFATVKYTSGGTQEWVKTYIGSANLSADANAVIVDHQNNIYVTGCDYGTDTTAEYVTIKYSPDGTEEWLARYAADVVQGDDWATAICVDQDNYIYVTGYSESSDGDPDYLTIKYSSSGPGIEENETSSPKNNIQMLQVWPNPFRTNCRIALYGSNVCEDMSTLHIYDVTGRLVRSFNLKSVIFWNATDNSGQTVPAGIYFIQLESSNCRQVTSVILSK